MVDVSGAKPIGDSGASRPAATTPVTGAAAAAASAPSAASGSAGTDTAQTSGLAADMAASPPVDTDRVATIKKAIAEGRFPILPATIADRLIALKLQWKPDGAGDDQA